MKLLIAGKILFLIATNVLCGVSLGILGVYVVTQPLLYSAISLPFALLTAIGATVLFDSRINAKMETRRRQ